MKKCLYLIAVSIIAMAGFYSCDEPDTDEFGDGSPNNPFKVETVADLKRVGTGETGPGGFAWKRDKHYVQIANIDLIGESNWTPIPSSSDFFSGTYNGKGFTISNLTISGDKEHVGLFGNLSGTVSNVRLNNVSISGKQYVGSVAGMLREHGTIDHCSAYNVEIFANSYGGGITGQVSYTAMVNACIVANGTVVGNNGSFYYSTGGITGDNVGTIKNCYTTVNVTGVQQVGGIAGTSSGTIQNCYATGAIYSKSFDVASIVGRTQGITRFCVALSNNVTKESGGATYAGRPTIGRVAGYNYNDGTMNYNHGRIDMVMKAQETDVPLGTEATLTGIHGADAGAADYHGADSDVWWNNTAGFPTAEWSFAKNRLPWLKGFDGLAQNPKVVD